MKLMDRSLLLVLLRRFGWAAFSVSAFFGAIAFPIVHSVDAQTVAPGQALTLRSDVQEANSVTGVITARGNVQINYPARQIQATSVQAQYYSREGRITLMGNVYVLQEGNSLRGETVDYYVNEGRFVARPDNGQQVESIYIVPEASPTPTAAATEIPPFNPKPEFKEPTSPLPGSPQ
jgi:lipopolysaccharide export system protein LptA